MNEVINCNICLFSISIYIWSLLINNTGLRLNIITSYLNQTKIKMAKQLLLSLLYLLFFSASVLHCQSKPKEKKLYIVYMGDKPKGNMLVGSLHHSMIETVIGSKKSVKDSLIYSYRKSFNGFVAKLSDEEAKRISGMDGVISVLPDRVLKLHTTRSWDFVGLKDEYSVGDSKGGDVIIGMLDTGIWPESASFSDKGFGPPPSKWKGKCHSTNKTFTCNNKIIGARYYNIKNLYDKTDIVSPRDSIGHGTHTASTAAGRQVEGASYFGLAKGVARGGAPNARLAVYKVCWAYGCSSADILAAFDDAIADGVDILSVSLGGGAFEPVEYFEDPIAIGSYHAMKMGILTSVSAGNEGPYRGSVTNYSPWLLTVAANSIDRKFVSQLVLGNGQIIPGVAINPFNRNQTSFPLIWGGDAANYSANANSLESRYCNRNGMDSEKLKGKIVLCENVIDGSSIMSVDGAGVIISSAVSGDDIVAYPFPLPSTIIKAKDVATVLDYIRSTQNPIATIQSSETWKDLTAPVVATFSSRGPNILNPDILKPDLTAPGVDIIAAWSPVAPSSIYYEDVRTTKYYLESGTSMSCPHVSGAAAYVKAAHPTWSPAAIKSALMTTATIVDPEKHKEDREFGYGSGLLNPVKAIDPGLIFNASETDYIAFLCKQGYNTTTLRLLTGDRSVCKSAKHGRGWDLNYPSFSLPIQDGNEINGIFTRTVTNVGSPNSTYVASIDPLERVKVKVDPPELTFNSVGEERSFTVKVKGEKITQLPIISGSITWNDGVHSVRTPLVIYTVLPPKSSSSKQFRPQAKESMSKRSSIFHKNGLWSRN
uniref:Cucumisin n=1 Tax=Datisca glomerata TaxID=34297 RepID=A0A3S8TL37_DATGL|nr:cucumisin [Datisca glomerata]